MEYHKINTMFKRNMEGDKKIVIGEFATPELEYLKDNDWTFTEKVDGTNIRVMWDGENVLFGGKTDNAQIPNGVINRLNDLFYSTPAKQRLKEIFPDVEDLSVIFYGEGYGAKIQTGGLYKATQDFVLFDVRIGSRGLWLERKNVEDIAKKLGVDVVPIIGHGTLLEGIELVRGGLKSQWGDFMAEGIVARPTVEMRTRRGDRIITKIKAVDFK